MRDLAATMGLSPPSLYNTFGDKQALFARALEHYLDHTTRLRLRRLETSLAPRQAIHQFFDEIIEHSVDDRQRKGCFLVNSALEIAPHDRELGAVIADRLGEIEAFFRRCIKGAQADGTAPCGIDAKDVARLSLGCFSASGYLPAQIPTDPCSKASQGRRSRSSTLAANKGKRRDDRSSLLDHPERTQDHNIS